MDDSKFATQLVCSTSVVVLLIFLSILCVLRNSSFQDASSVVFLLPLCVSLFLSSSFVVSSTYTLKTQGYGSSSHRDNRELADNITKTMGHSTPFLDLGISLILCK